MSARRLLTAVTLAVWLALPLGVGHAYEPGQVLFRFADSRITESSGLVTSSVSDDWLFTHNDSGDEARFYVVDRRGRTLARHTMPGIDADDWEDIARGPDEQGRSSLWLGDIGDNAMLRESVIVYRVPEPPVDPSRIGLDVTTPAPAVFTLAYEDVAHDAETLLVHPRTGRLYVVTKTYVGVSSLYAAPTPLVSGAVNELTRVADLAFSSTGTPGGAQFGPGANLAVTGGDISPSGDRLALRTYTDLYEWDLPDDDIAAAVAPTQPRRRTPLPETVQGEAIGYSQDGRSILVSTEGEQAPVHLLAAEPAVASSPTAAAAPPSPAESGSASASSDSPATPQRAASGRPGSVSGSLAATGPPYAPTLLAAGLCGAAALLRRRHRYPRSSHSSGK